MRVCVGGEGDEAEKSQTHMFYFKRERKERENGRMMRKSCVDLCI